MFERELTIINFTFATLLLLVAFSFKAAAQQPTQTPPTLTDPKQMTSSISDTNIKKTTTPARTELTPVYTNFMGVNLGMTADEAREKLGNPKDKGRKQDFFVLSDSMTAQIFYDNEAKVVAISVDYVGPNSKAPSPEDVLGEAVQAKPDGSIHELKRYPQAGYWVAFNRTSGDNPITTVTLQKI